MKKFLSLILTIMIAAAFVACGKNEETKPQVEEPETIVDEVENVEEAEDGEAEKENQDKAEVDDDKPVAEKPTETKPEDSKPAENKPESKPTENKPVEKPAESKPVETPVTGGTLGNTLLAEFKTNAKAGKSSEDIVSALSAKISAFGAIVPTPVAQGDYLPGFDNSEIKGFKSGIVFMPMIGSTPFVGYVFELDGTVSASDFISSLKKDANMRWLICAEAEEMVAGSEGNKVFFVMCPKSIGE